MVGTEVERCFTAVLGKNVGNLTGFIFCLQLGDEGGTLLGIIDGFELSLLFGDEEDSEIGLVVGAEDWKLFLIEIGAKLCVERKKKNVASV